MGRLGRALGWRFGWGALVTALGLLARACSDAPAVSEPAHSEPGRSSCSPGTSPADPESPGPGIPAGGCARGFEHDGIDTCQPILPASTCPAGRMAIPGEPACREVAPCGPGTYGDIPVDDATQFVDAQGA